MGTSRKKYIIANDGPFVAKALREAIIVQSIDTMKIGRKTIKEFSRGRETGEIIKILIAHNFETVKVSAPSNLL